MKWQRSLPVALIILTLLILVALMTERTGGISQEAIAVLLVLTIGLTGSVLLTRDESNEKGLIGHSTHSSNQHENVTQDNKSALPDPLDEGFDTPLL